LKNKNRWSKRKHGPVHTGVSVTPGTYAKIAYVAKREGTTMAAVVTAMVERAVERPKGRRKP
jgi:hypothetical protein